MSLEAWKTVFETGSVILLFLTFLFGAGAFLTTREINERQAEQLRTFELDLAKQQERAATAEAQLLQLQRSAVHRTIPQTGEGDKRNWDVLKPFKGTKVVLSHSPQSEPAGFAGNLGAILSNAGWVLAGGINPSGGGGLPDGVRIEAHLGSTTEADPSEKAAEALAEFLRTYGIEGVTVAGRKDMPANTLFIQIGQMPDPSRFLK